MSDNQDPKFTVVADTHKHGEIVFEFDSQIELAAFQLGAALIPGFGDCLFAVTIDQGVNRSIYDIERMCLKIIAENPGWGHEVATGMASQLAEDHTGENGSHPILAVAKGQLSWTTYIKEQHVNLVKGTVVTDGKESVTSLKAWPFMKQDTGNQDDLIC